jgi:hypothetical protein
MAGRAKIGVCRDAAEVALVRAMFGANGIDLVIGAEQHAAMLGGLGAGFLSLDIIVDADDADRAAELLRELREGTHATDGDNSNAGDSAAGHSAADHDVEDLAEGELPIDVRIARRRRTGIAVMLSLFITFGTGHMFMRAWARAVLLAGVEVFGFVELARGQGLGGLLVIGAIATDAIGSVIRARAIPRLPEARTRRR